MYLLYIAWTCAKDPPIPRRENVVVKLRKADKGGNPNTNDRALNRRDEVFTSASFKQYAGTGREDCESL